jgi:hypothetical protein
MIDYTSFLLYYPGLGGFMYIIYTTLIASILFFGCNGLEEVKVKSTCTLTWDGTKLMADMKVQNPGSRDIPSVGYIASGIQWTNPSGTSIETYSIANDKSYLKILAGQTLDLGEQQINVGTASGIKSGDKVNCASSSYSDSEIIGTNVENTDPDLTYDNPGLITVP